MQEKLVCLKEELNALSGNFNGYLFCYSHTSKLGVLIFERGGKSLGITFNSD